GSVPPKITYGQPESRREERDDWNRREMEHRRHWEADREERPSRYSIGDEDHPGRRTQHGVGAVPGGLLGIGSGVLLFLGFCPLFSWLKAKEGVGGDAARTVSFALSKHAEGVAIMATSIVIALFSLTSMILAYTINRKSANIVGTVSSCLAAGWGL